MRFQASLCFGAHIAFPLALISRSGRMADYDGTQTGEGRETTASSLTPSDAPGRARETVLGNCARCGSGDKLKFCSRCQAVRYCGPECQKADVRGAAMG